MRNCYLWCVTVHTQEIITLDDYRARHASHRKDEGLQLLTRSAPTLAMWGALRLLELFHAPVYH
jgi:hypothetical protein